MYDLTNKETIQNIFHKHNLAPNKFMGQNFLIDKNVLEKILETAGVAESDNIIEIGPGFGVLTQALLEKGANVIAIEKDKELIPALEDNLKEYKKDFAKNDKSGIKIINDDFLQVDPEKILELILGSSASKYDLEAELPSISNPKSYKIVSNIPYYITSPALRKIFSVDKLPSQITLLVQREVAERIASKPGDMSFISVFVQYYGTPSIEEIVKPGSFWPAPEVDSAILKIVPDKKVLLEDDKLKEFWRLIKIGFSSRRKTLANNLAAGFHAKPTDVRELLKSLGFTDKTRAQELSVEDWIKLLKESAD